MKRRNFFSKIVKGLLGIGIVTALPTPEVETVLSALKNEMNYIDLMNEGIPAHLLPPDTSLYCKQCYHRAYVSEDEMQFLKEGKHIINNYILTPHMPVITPFNMDHIKPIATHHNSREKENIYVSNFCPKCNKEAFGELSNWRESPK